MKNLRLIIKTEIDESLRARWFYLYSLVFGGAVLVLFWTGLTESQVMGFTGLSRLLLTYFQLCIVILPIFILATTVRSIVGEKESNVLEYLLSMPVSLSDFFWGKFIGRLIIVLVPIIAALALALIIGKLKGSTIEAGVLIIYSLLLFSLSAFFLGMATLISSLVHRQETGLSAAFFAWLVLVLFIDIILIGLFLKYQIDPELMISISIINPLQDFRTAAMSLFDPDLTMLGPSSWFILDTFGKAGLLVFSVLYPFFTGIAMAFGGFIVFTKRDIV